MVLDDLEDGLPVWPGHRVERHGPEDVQVVVAVLPHELLQLLTRYGNIP